MQRIINLKLPFYSIVDNLKDGDIDKKIISCALAFYTLYINTPLSIEELISQAFHGISYEIPSTLILLAMMHAMWYMNTLQVPDQYQKSWADLIVPDFEWIDEDGIAAMTYGPVDEEITSRGILLPLIKELLIFFNMSISNASFFSIISSSFIFAFQHNLDRRPSLPFPQFIGGVMCGYLKEKFGLFASITAHMTHNSLLSLSSTFLAIKDFIRDKLKQIESVQSEHRPYVSAKPNVDQNILLSTERSNLTFENKALKKIIHLQDEGDDQDIKQLLFGDKIPNDQLIKENQELLAENKTLREQAKIELSKSYIYNFFIMSQIQIKIYLLA